jgi:hypothetical protein
VCAASTDCPATETSPGAAIPGSSPAESITRLLAGRHRQFPPTVGPVRPRPSHAALVALTHTATDTDPLLSQSVYQLRNGLLFRP